MASNFQIFSYKTKDSLHLKLAGDFDGSSAHELINKLLEHGAGFYQIFIDTSDLKTIHPFGRNVFEKKFCSFKKQLGQLLFIGENGHKFATD
jgi:anti-anti-sigma regulatory factor